MIGFYLHELVKSKKEEETKIEIYNGQGNKVIV
jgi:hypothetical protein